MFFRRYSIRMVMEMCCCRCFGFPFPRKPNRPLKHNTGPGTRFAQELLFDGDLEGEDHCSSDDDITNIRTDDNYVLDSPSKHSEDILMRRTQNGNICRQVPVKETHIVFRSEDENGNKTVNEYVRVCKIGSGSYGKVVLYQSSVDGKQYAIKAFRKSHLLKLRVAPSETAMNDVLREVLIMKTLEHPNIVNLVEVIDDSTADHFYMVLEYVEGKRVCEGLGETTARKHLRDIISGLMYLHSHNIVHGDIKPDNLLVTVAGTVKIGDFSVSQVFEDDNDVLRRTPGTPVFTAPECCLGITYHGKTADIWAVGVTLYCMLLGKYPFLGQTLQDTYDKIVNDPLSLPDELNPLIKELLEGLLCKDPTERMALETVAKHVWVVGEEGSIPHYLCWCKGHRLRGKEFEEAEEKIKP